MRPILAILTFLHATAHPAAAQRSGPDAANIARQVDSLAAEAIRAGLAPALGVAIAMDGKTIYSKSHGMADVTNHVAADARTLWYLASTSKSLTGFGVSLLADAGALRFETPIATLLPNASWHPGAHPERLTLASFLSHTHHLDDRAIVMSAAFTGEVPESRWPQMIALAGPTGNEDLVYTNFGYNVAAMVIDRVRPEGWKAYLQQAVYSPAGMRETYARVSGVDGQRIAKPHRLTADGHFITEPFFKTDATMNSAGGHLATLDDLARWAIVQMDSGEIDGRRVFPASAVALSHRLIARQTREQSKRFAFFERYGWSAGWDIGSYEGEPMVSRFGGYMSTRSHLSFLPDRRIGVVAMSTGGLGSSLTDVIAAFVYDLDAGRPDVLERARERVAQLQDRLASARRSVATSDSVRAERQRQPLGRPLTDFTGTFHDDNYGAVVFRLENGRLQYRWGALYGPAETHDASRGQLRVEVAGSGTVVSFDLPARGPATAITINGIRFGRADTPDRTRLLPPEAREGRVR